MTAHWRRAVVLLAVLLVPQTLWAQSRQDLQMQQDIRMLQEQIQQLRLAVAALADQTKTTNAKLDSQAELLQKNNANQSLTLGSVQTQVSALVEKLNQYSLQVNRFAAEIPAIRAGMEQQQKTLTRILALVDVPSPTAPANTSAGAPPVPGAPLPSSPNAVFQQAKSMYAAGDYELAARAFEDFLKNFPDAAVGFGGEAGYLLGMSHFNQAHYPAALAALTAVVENYKSSDRAADANYQQGECYRQMADTKKAQAAFQQTMKDFPDSPAALQAKQALIRMGVPVK